MFCKQCGTKLDDDAQFCEHCGTVIKRIASEVSISGDSEATNTQEQNVSPVMINEDEQPKAKSIKKKSKKGLFIGITAILVVIVVGIALSGMLGGGSNGKSSNIYHESNFNNGAKFAYDNSRLYFVGLYDEDDEDTVVYSTDYKGVNKTLISDNGDIISIRICDGRIYYKTSGDEEYTIGVMDTDGSSDATIVKNEESLGHYDVHGDKLYYLLDAKIHVCNFNGEEDAIILEEVETFTLCNGVIYFVSNSDVINSYRIKNGETKELCKSSGASSLSVDGNTLYFACDTGLSSISISEDATVTKVIRDSSLYSYVFYNDCIYYNHQMSDDDRESIAEYLGEDDWDVLTYKLALIGAGSIYKAPISGGDGESVDSDQIFVYSLYSYPQGLYCKVTILGDSIEPVDLD